MANEKVQEFPELGNKLGAPTKKSLFERQKAEAEAKRLKEQQETAAVYEDFVKSFDDDGDSDSGPPVSRASLPGSGPGAPGGFSKRHFTGPPTRGRASGPGSLGPPTNALSRKRNYDGDPTPSRDSPRGMFAFEDKQSTKAAFNASDDEDEADSAMRRAQEKAAHKPTLHLSSLPPGTSPAAIKSLIPENVKVEAVRIIQGSGTGSTDRRGQSAIVTMASETPAADLDAIVSSLQNNYLGRGFYLSLARHLSSAVAGNLPTSTGASTTLPFGAKPAQLPPGRGGGFTRPGPRGGFAPPPGYGSSSFGRPPPVHVSVTPPTDLKQLKLIHKTVESLIKHGPEFEALLMSRPEVQKEEKWAWLWDPTSTGGVWYRWRLWDILTNARNRQKTKRGVNDGQSQIVFDGGAPWTAPERVLPFEYTTVIEEFVSDEDYHSSSDEDSGDEGRRRLAQMQGGAGVPANAAAPDAEQEAAYLTPLHKSKLVHLLSRLPDTTAKLRRGDVARITAFAIQHAGTGAEEVVNLLVSNVQTPFSLTAAKARDRDNPNESDDGNDNGTHSDGDAAAAAVDKTHDEDRDKDKDKPAPGDAGSETDPSQHKLIALYLISDILSSSSTSGVRHAWRYRQLFETALRTQTTFAQLGRVEKDLRWGRLRAEKWKRAVNAVLGLWEGWCVFPAAAHEALVDEFVNPPLAAAEKGEERRKEEEAREREKAKSSKWRSVEEREREKREGGKDGDGGGDVDGTPMEDVDGEPMGEDEDVDGEPMDEDIDGEPMDDDDEDMDGDPMEEDADGGDTMDKDGDGSTEYNNQEGAKPEAQADTTPGKRRRPKAEDMFADSDED